ncbi:hypothetical protein GCM10010038_19360 [Glutamicibacter protophormiae]|nr:hypothetical protein GCM10010038_19360 [Glutamicibacter protophormiae]
MQRFNRTMLEQWAYAIRYRAVAEPVAALQGWLGYENYRRGQASLKARVPTDSVLNLGNTARRPRTRPKLSCRS